MLEPVFRTLILEDQDCFEPEEGWKALLQLVPKEAHTALKEKWEDEPYKSSEEKWQDFEDEIEKCKGKTYVSPLLCETELLMLIPTASPP